jgi:hypothetical protein
MLLYDDDRSNMPPTLAKIQNNPTMIFMSHHVLFKKWREKELNCIQRHREPMVALMDGISELWRSKVASF